MISKRIRFEVFKRDYFTCQYCGAQAPAVLLHADHIHPRSKGGDDELMNLVTACESCNLGKSNVSFGTGLLRGTPCQQILILSTHLSNTTSF